MDLPFSQSDFLAVFARYNESMWPLQILLMTAAVISILGIWRGRSQWSRAVLFLLAGLWLWMGAVYHGIYFSSINPAARLFAVLFVAQGGLLLITAIRDSVRVEARRDPVGILGSVLMAFALVVYPALGYVLGHRYPHSPTFGLPCPTTLFTLGVLLWAHPLRVRLFAIPLIWAAIGFLAAIQLGIYEDVSLLVAGAAVVIVIFRRDRFEKRLASSSAAA